MKLTKNNKIRVLYIHDRPSGGAGESLYQMIHENNLWNTKGVVFMNTGFLKNKFKKLEPNIKTYYIKGSSWLGSVKNKDWLYKLSQLYYYPRRYGFSKRINSTINQEKIEIIHTNTVTIIQGGKVAKKRSIPHIIQVRELLDLDFYKYPISKKKVIKELDLYSDVIIANSNRTKTGLLELGMKTDKIKVIHNSVSPAPIQYDIRDRLGLDKKSKIVAIVGWIRPIKRIEDFIEISKYFTERNDIKFVLVGGYGTDVKYNEQIKKQVVESSNIIYAGLLDNAPYYMKSFNLLISTCEIESFGRTVAEALIEGTPAIGIKNCAVAEIIQHEKSGYLVNKSDISSFVNYTKLLLDNESLNESMGFFGKQDVEKNFGIQKIRNQYLKLYQELIN